ncbi:MAG: hypothetical protein HUJ89_00670 [Bacteroidales bacterium]|nr:hypothetical protein [Bacteroidales bacterium]
MTRSQLYGGISFVIGGGKKKKIKFLNFNPFMLYYDTLSENWKMLELLPILPNFSYKITF